MYHTGSEESAHDHILLTSNPTCYNGYSRMDTYQLAKLDDYYSMVHITHTGSHTIHRLILLPLWCMTIHQKRSHLKENFQPILTTTHMCTIPPKSYVALIWESWFACDKIFKGTYFRMNTREWNRYQAPLISNYFTNIVLGRYCMCKLIVTRALTSATHDV